MNFPKNLDVFIYLRKSRKDIEEEKKAGEEGREFDTLQRHRKQLFELAKKENYTVLEQFEEIVSGEYISERPMIQMMLREIEKGMVDAVLVMDIDRLGRGDMVDQGTIYRVFRFSETLIITPTEIINPNDDNQELNFSIKSLIAREELKAIVKRMQRGRRASAKEGKSISRVPPFGYTRDENLKLIPCKDKAPIVELIFNNIANGKGRQLVAQELDKLGISPPEGEFWNPSTISSIIKNEVYLGHIIWGKIKYTKKNGKYEKQKVNPKNWNRHNHAHKPIVSEELFEKANIAHHKRWRPPSKKSTKLANPLAGLLLCQICGRTMVFQNRKDRPNPQVRCKTHSCKGVQKGASLQLIESRVLDGLKQIVDSFDIKHNMIEVKKESNPVDIIENTLKEKELEYKELQKQKSKLHDLLELGIYDTETFIERQKELGKRMTEKKELIENMQLDLEVYQKREENLEKFLPSILNVLNSYKKTNDIEKKNRLLKTVLDKILFLRKQEWTKPDEFQIELFTRL